MADQESKPTAPNENALLAEVQQFIREQTEELSKTLGPWLAKQRLAASQGTHPELSVVDLMNAGASLEQVKEHLRKQIAPSPDELSETLKNWLPKQKQDTATDKQNLVNLVNQLGYAFGSGIYSSDGKPCYITVMEHPTYPNGRYRLREAGNLQTSTNRTDITDILPLKFEPTPEVAIDTSVPDDFTGREKARRKPRHPSGGREE